MKHIIKARDKQASAFETYQREFLEDLADIPEEPELEEDDPAEPLPDPAEILAAARAEAERKVQEAYAEGYRRGEEKGREEFLAKVGESAEVFREAAQCVEDAQQTFFATLVPQIARLTQSVSARILQRECATDEELIKRTARTALESLVDRQRILIRVHPDDLAVLRQYKSELIEEFEGIERFRIEAAGNVRRGGCTVESDTMMIDASVETQLKRIYDTLLE
jgi:flagellar assembly protein FliH